MRTTLGSRLGKWQDTSVWYGYLLAVACILVSTTLFFFMRDYFAKGQWALLYLLIIGLIAGLSGVRPAILAAFLAFLAWNYFFLPPYHTFYIRDPKDWIALFAFLAVGIAMGVQTGRMREREAEALAREREMELLNQFSAHLVSDTPIPDMAKALLVELSPITTTSCAAVLLPDKSGKLQAVDASPEKSCRADVAVMQLAEWAHRESKAIGLPRVTDVSIIKGGWPVSVAHEIAGADGSRKDLFLPLLTATSRQGVLYIGEREDGTSYSDRDARLLVGVANQVAAFLERKRLQDVAVQADALREADRLKSTLVSSVSHELKTPLASVTATISNLLESDVVWDQETVRRELEALQEDLHRLNSSIGSLLDLSRLESGSWSPTKDWYEFGEILGTALTKIPQSQRGRITYTVPENLPAINVDFAQLVRAIQNLLENALAYSEPGTPVLVDVTADSNELEVSVEDRGPGIPPEERERVFEKFYRGESSGRVPSGTGLGLAVTKEIVRSHGGRIWVEDASPCGARFVVALPLKSEEEVVG